VAVTKDEFIQMQKTVKCRETRRLWMLLVAGWSLLVLIALFGKEVLNYPAVEDFFLSLATANRHWIPAGFGMLALGMFLSFAALARKPGGITCPKCHRPISSTITLLTSNCGRCGERIIS
jgi:hypothetical protein